MNKDYWNSFYSNNIFLAEPSSFAKFVFTRIKKTDKLLDLGCGNGRDTYYFLSNGIDAYGIDLNSPKEQNFIQGDVIENLFESNVYYMRFFAHAIEEEVFDSLLRKIANISEKESQLFIETRSCKGVIQKEKKKVKFKSGIGEEHYRFLYSKSYLIKKLEKYFQIEYCAEDYGLSPFNGEDPCLIRTICRVK